ncbi:inorganic pyrophospatase PpaX [Paenibacillus sp. JCM 10914]|nr:inorganic pyrophospatase PpaX [Paenibacillus sp. JCM 10914]
MIETVLFDLDGTIIDTNELIISSFLHVFEQHTSGSLTREQIIRIWEPRWSSNCRLSQERRM